jgi:hypothetical protein
LSTATSPVGQPSPSSLFLRFALNHPSNICTAGEDGSG